MTLQQLEYIVAVAKYRHFGKAADHCKVTQPTLSSMVQKLEEELGIKIFDRTVKPVAPTSCGRLVIDQALNVISSALKIKDIVADEKGSLSGTFRIGILPTIAPYLLPRFFPQLSRQYSELDLRVVEMKTTDIKRSLSSGELDAAIVARLDGMNHFVQTTLFYEQFMAYVSDNDSLSASKTIRAADLNGKFLWLLDEGHCFSEQLIKFCELKSAARSKKTYSLGSIETFMRMVENGKGITFIPELALPQLSDMQRRLVRPFAIPIPVREIVMLSNKTCARHTVLSLIETKIKECVPEKMLCLNNTEWRV